MPHLRVSEREFTKIMDEFVKKGDELMQVPPEEWDTDFDGFLNSFKTALLLEMWISETGVDEVLTKFRVTPGELYSKLGISDWLIYTLQELAFLAGKKESLKVIRKMRTRMKYGVKEELLPLVKLKGIGRKRGRKLFNFGIKGIAQVRKAPIETLETVLGKNVAKSVKGQVE